ncbi:SH3 domain-containing protein [Sporodiniella umbellata]|nr:SH3 domain-containing protein [Sporodiniella umbellata]
MTEIRVLCKVQALYAFKSNDPSSLCFEQDDYIDVLTKLPSGWWDGLCNGMRGWFPSNYVKTVEDNESPLEREARIRNVAYRLSLMSNTNTAHWTQQRTEDGVDTYYYNDVTGEMRIDPPSEFERFRESSLTLENNESLWSDQSTIASSLMEREVRANGGLLFLSFYQLMGFI